MRDAFAVLFFVSVGMMVDPAQLWSHLDMILVTVLVIIVGKGLAAFLVVKLLRYPTSTAIAVAVALAQIGEFSFILSNLGRDSGVLPAEANQVLVAASILAITLNPILFRAGGDLAKWFARRSSAPTEAAPEDVDPTARAIVVGYGPVGRTVTRLLRENAISATIIELNLETVRELVAAGQSAVYGDASQASILENAGIRSVNTLVFAASGTPPRAIVETARGLNPNLRILARSMYAREAQESRAAGADRVVTAEIEVALAMAESLMAELGATAEQLDRARQRTREDFALGPL
jgi:CPA2 family monovalent cation:H+ antiporter-2